MPEAVPSSPQTRVRSPLFAVIDRMLFLELAKTLISILMILVVIIVSRKFLDILAKAIEGEVSGDTLFQLLGLKTVSAIAILIPPSTFMAILTVIGRMYRDHEMSILASGGMGSARLYRALAWLVVPVFLLSGWLSLAVMPWTEREAQALVERDEQSADIRGIKAGRFNEFSAGDVVLYAEEMDSDNIMRNIFAQKRQDTVTEVVSADRGHLDRNELDEYFVILSDGRSNKGTPGLADFEITDFREYAVRVGAAHERSAVLKREAESSANLLHNRTPKELAELQKRLAVPLGVITLALLAVPLARVAPRGGPYGSVFTAFLIYVVYENAQKISQGMLMTEKIPAWASYSAIYGILLAVTLALFMKNLGVGWVLNRLLGKTGT